MKFFIILIIAALLSGGVTLVAQQTPELKRKYQLAKSYEESGDFENAARLYIELYETNAAADKYFEGFKRALLAQNKFSTLLPYVEERLQSTKTVPLYALLGDLFWKLGKTSQADKAWEDGLTLKPDDKKSYVHIANAQIENRLFAKAVQTFLRARSHTGVGGLFSNELSRLYGAVGKYSEGTKEVLLSLRISRKLSKARGFISAYLINEDGVAQTGVILEEEAQKNPNDILIQKLYEWFLREQKQYDKAFEIYKRIDRLSNANGRELLTFANLAQREGFYDAALQAYAIVIDKGKKNPNAKSALFGYARTMEYKLNSGEELSREEVDKIIDRYEQIIVDYPKTKFAADSKYRQGVLLHTRLKEYDQAIEVYDALIKKHKNNRVAAQGAIALGDLYVELGRLNEARETYGNSVKIFKRYQNQVDKANYALAELDYFEGNLDSARASYMRLTHNSNADIANDALEKISLLDDNDSEQERAAVREYAAAELRQRQNKPFEAKALYLKAVELAPESQLAQQCLLIAGNLEFGHKQYAAARELFNRLLADYPQSIYADFAQYHIGETYIAENRKDDAINAFNDVLIRYPSSTLLQEARKHIRTLRGDTW